MHPKLLKSRDGLGRWTPAGAVSVLDQTHFEPQHDVTLMVNPKISKRIGKQKQQIKEASNGNPKHLKFRSRRHRLAAADQLGAATKVPPQPCTRSNETQRTGRHFGHI